jgi:hypothetical protein
MRLAARIHPFVGLGFVVALGWGCGDSASNGTSVVVPTDAGLPFDVAVAPTPDARGAEVAEAGRDAGVDAATLDAPGDSLGRLPPVILVEILKPVAALEVDGGLGDGGLAPPILPKNQKLAPEVRVTVVSQTGDATEDLLSKVSASLTPVKGGPVATSANLVQVQFDRAPETNTAVYLFADKALDLAALTSGEYSLTVQAVTAGGAKQSVAVQVFIDAGPIIQFVQPVADSAWKGSMIATALVSDFFAGVKTVQFAVGQTVIDPTAIVIKGDRYSATIDFNGFPVPLDGPQLLTITALNGNDVQSTASQRFVVDNQGPTITNTSPAVAGMIGRIITIQATVTDPAGVVDSSVVAVVAHGNSKFQVTLTKGKDNVYAKLFDTTQLPVHAIFPTISFRAQDVLGNQSSVGYDLSLDNTPPIIDLDPPDNFQLFKLAGAKEICSWPFDPVGPDAIDDGSIVSQLFDIRARIEDEGNEPLTGGADFIPISGVAASSVKVLILDDTSRPLVVDTSDPPDGICDAVNPDLVPTSAPQSDRDAQLLGMVPMPPNTGAGDFSPKRGLACAGQEAPPKLLCDTTYNVSKQRGMTYSLGYAGNLPSIWTIAPIVADGLQCAGRQFDSSNNLTDGWACVAVVASDGLGNKQVSRPLRICVEASGSTACATTPGTVALAQVALSSSAKGEITFTTKAPLRGAGDVALVKGDAVNFQKVYPQSMLSGTHTVEPLDGTGTRFRVLDLSVVAPQLSAYDGADGALRIHGPVGVVIRTGEPIAVITDPLTMLDPAYTGLIRLTYVSDQPNLEGLEFAVTGITPEGFSLVEAIAAPTLTTSGTAIAESRLPNCTGTAVSQGSNLPPIVDYTKACKPWRSFPAQEARYQ